MFQHKRQHALIVYSSRGHYDGYRGYNFLRHCPYVATGSYNSSITYIYKCVLYCYEMEDDITSRPG
jgi:hypothetical protein